MSTQHAYTYRHPHPAVTSDCVVFGYDMNDLLSILLIQRGSNPYRGRWTIPGGFLEMNEDAMSCTRRELKEETGLEISSLEEIGSFSDVGRDTRERVVSIALFTLSRTRPVKCSDDAVQAHRFPLQMIFSCSLFDGNQCSTLGGNAQTSLFRSRIGLPMNS